MIRSKLERFTLSESVIRFLIVGITAFIVEYGSFYIFYPELHWRLYVANSLSFILGLLTSFSLNRLWTFRHPLEYKKRTVHQLSYYAGLAAINFGLTNLIVEILFFMGLNPKVGKLIAMVVTSSWNYILFKVFIFNHKEDSD